MYGVCYIEVNVRSGYARVAIKPFPTNVDSNTVEGLVGSTQLEVQPCAGNGFEGAA